MVSATEAGTAWKPSSGRVAAATAWATGSRQRRPPCWRRPPFEEATAAETRLDEAVECRLLLAGWLALSFSSKRLIGFSLLSRRNHCVITASGHSMAALY